MWRPESCDPPSRRTRRAEKAVTSRPSSWAASRPRADYFLLLRALFFLPFFFAFFFAIVRSPIKRFGGVASRQSNTRTPTRSDYRSRWSRALSECAKSCVTLLHGARSIARQRPCYHKIKVSCQVGSVHRRVARWIRASVDHLRGREASRVDWLARGRTVWFDARRARAGSPTMKGRL